MAIPSHIYRLVFAGTLGPAVDEWQVRLHLQLQGNTDLTGWETGYCNDAADSWGGTIMESTAPVYTANDTVLQSVTLYQLDTAGHTEALWMADEGHVGVAGTGGDSLPSEIAVVATLETAHLGRSYRGRMYLPGLAKAACGADGLISLTYYENIATQVAALITALDKSIDDELPTVMNVGILSETKGIFTEVIGTKVGNVFDAQRRRRNGAPETYSLESVTPAIPG